MGKKILLFIGILIFILLLSGCQEENITDNYETNANIHFLSKDLQILELINSSFEISKDNNDKITRVQLLFKFKNLVDKTIRDLSLDISYYDKNNNELFNSTFSYPNIPPNWVEADSSRPKPFEGLGVEKFDYVNIRIKNYKILE